MKLAKWGKWFWIGGAISFIQLVLGHPLHAIWGMLFLIMILLMGIVYGMVIK